MPGFRLDGISHFARWFVQIEWIGRQRAADDFDRPGRSSQALVLDLSSILVGVSNHGRLR